VAGRVGIWSPNNAEWILTQFEPVAGEAAEPWIDPDEPVNIQFTSGTTGLPKGATLTHFNIVNNGYFVAEGMLTQPGDRICVPVPLYHCFGMVMGVLGAVTHGATVVLPAESFEAEATLAAVAEERCAPLEKRVATVGRIHPHVQVKLIDAEGHVVPRGERGELLTRGYNVMRGYWDDPERTSECLDIAGWMHTGDLATIDAEGYCSIVGRVKDMIIRGGENIYPREIEEFLLRHPESPGCRRSGCV